MKKHVLLVAAALSLTVASNAQDLKNKDGHMILPESGDWALGFDANPLLNYVGDMFNGASGNTLNAAWENGNNAIMGKYFLDSETAVRGWLRLGFGSTTTNNLVTDDVAVAADPASTAMVNDELKEGGSNIVLGGGIEKRKGHNRLQGYYGGDLLIMTSSSKDTYTYGNAMSTTTFGATTTDFNTMTSSFTNSRMTEQSSGTFGLGLRGVIGIEYFFAPKISIGAEYGWGLAFSSQSDVTTMTEQLNTAGTGFETVETVSAGGSSFGIDTDNNGGAIRLMFHF